MRCRAVLFHELPVRSPGNRRMKKMRGLLRKVRSACQAHRDYIPDILNHWCNFAHIHLDWHGYGDYSRKARLLFLEEYARRFARFAENLSRQKKAFQLWLLIFPHDSGSDCLYYHTPNLHSGFPVTLEEFTWESSPENLFSTLLPDCTILEGKSGDGLSLAYYAQGVGMPLS